MDLAFNPASPKICSLRSGSLPPLRRFQVSRTNPILQPKMVEVLRAFAESSEVSFPCVEPLQAGRSVYASTAADSEWRSLGICGVKGKGLYGLVRLKNKKLGLVFPSPSKPYGDSPPWHISLNKNYEIIPVQSTPKGTNTLAREGAEREFDCLQQLSKCGVSLPSLLAGRFLDHEQRAILDFKGGETGAVYCAHDPDAKPLHYFHRFVYTETSPYTADYCPPESNHLRVSKTPIETLADNYVRFIYFLAELKARSIFDGGVMRHSSHSGNFFFNPQTGRFYQTDFDTCFLVTDIPRELRAAQFIRDASTSMQSMIEDLSLWSYSNDWLDYLRYRPSPFYPYLKGLFKDFADDSQIMYHAERLQAHYLVFIQLRPYLKRPAEEYRTGFRTCDHSLMGAADWKWGFMHTPFLAHCICEIYALARESRLPDEFKPPPAKLDRLYADLIKGIEILRAKKLEQRGIKPT